MPTEYIPNFETEEFKKMSLEELGIKHKTAKVPHGYLPIYERFFRDMKVNRLLEIGVAEGASMKMWREYFPNAEITGIDKTLTYQNDNVRLLEADATRLDLYKNDFFFPHLDIIIDDASHIAKEQIVTFKKLWDVLRPNGLYVIEDLFTLYDTVWNPNLTFNIMDLIQDRMKNILTGGDSISEVHYYGRNDINGILFLRKRKEKFRIQPLEEFNM